MSEPVSIKIAERDDGGLLMVERDSEGINIFGRTTGLDETEAILLAKALEVTLPGEPDGYIEERLEESLK